MDKGVLALFIPILALAIPVAAVVFSNLIKLQKLRIEEAKVRAGFGGEDVHALAEEVSQLRQELTDVQERLDFTERILAKSREAPPALPEA